MKFNFSASGVESRHAVAARVTQSAEAGYDLSGGTSPGMSLRTGSRVSVRPCTDSFNRLVSLGEKV
jgi:hypothetical protein